VIVVAAQAELKEQWDQPDLHVWVLFLWETYVIHIAFHESHMRL
jgi:hypothetical protein